MSPHPFFAPIARHFNMLLSEYDFHVVSQQFEDEGFGSGMVRLQSDRYYLDFQMENMGPEVTLYTGCKGQLATDVAWIFAYLIRSANLAPSTAAPWLYYYPHFTLGMWGETSVSWQIERLADILKSMWPAIFIFLDMDGPHNKDFIDFKERAMRTAAERKADGFRESPAHLVSRAQLGFAPLVEKSFSYLTAYKFKIVHSDPIFVRFENNETSSARYINVFHRLRSFQLGLETGQVQNDPAFELNFDLEELAAWSGTPYQPAVVHTTATLQVALNRMARFFRRSAALILAGDPRLYEALHARRIDAARRASRAWAERARVPGHSF
jgi:hypothetical protein